MKNGIYFLAVAILFVTVIVVQTVYLEQKNDSEFELINHKLDDIDQDIHIVDYKLNDIDQDIAIIENKLARMWQTLIQ